MAIKPGSLDDFGGSMAEAIENELNARMILDGLPELPMDDTPERRDRRRLFVAIARGVMRHLKDHEASIVVPYKDGAANRVTSPNMTITGL